MDLRKVLYIMDLRKVLYMLNNSDNDNEFKVIINYTILALDCITNYYIVGL